jgi:hypothetical protein
MKTVRIETKINEK